MACVGGEECQCAAQSLPQDSGRDTTEQGNSSMHWGRDAKEQKNITKGRGVEGEGEKGEELEGGRGGRDN